MDTTLLLTLVLPIFGAVVIFFAIRDWKISAISAGAGAALIAIVFACSYGAAVADTEIWSGQVVGKTRVHGTYEESYDCNCSTDSKGNSHCSTCYRTHYTVNWACQTTIGGIGIDSRDSTWRSIYETPDPTRYSIINIGDPVSKQHMYVNYVQAVPNSLFAAINGSTMAKYQGQLPAYPDRIYDIYHVDRFVTNGVNVPDARSWNDDISDMLRELGPKKQANVIVAVTKNQNAEYADALRDAWEGVNKNDIVVVLGSPDGQTIQWVRILSWTKNELFKIQLRDRILALGKLDRVQVLAQIQDQVATNFERRHMKEFEYLKGEIDPPGWLLILTVVVLCLGYGGGVWYLIRDARGTYRRRW
jgi:hypothetical protein